MARGYQSREVSRLGIAITVMAGRRPMVNVVTRSGNFSLTGWKARAGLLPTG